MATDNGEDLKSIRQMIEERFTVLEGKLTEIYEAVLQWKTEKEWYTTTEVAEMMDKSQYTVQSRWCSEGRVECEKDPDTGRWRIPGQEYRRLESGGELLPKTRS